MNDQIAAVEMDDDEFAAALDSLDTASSQTCGFCVAVAEYLL